MLEKLCKDCYVYLQLFLFIMYSALIQKFIIFLFPDTLTAQKVLSDLNLFLNINQLDEKLQ